MEFQLLSIQAVQLLICQPQQKLHALTSIPKRTTSAVKDINRLFLEFRNIFK